MPTPNPTTRREYKGAAAASTLASSMANSDASFTLTATNNWPTGAVGQFIVTVSRGLADEEKILCSAQASKVVTVVTRGFDGTAAQAHASGSTVECTISAFDADEWNQHTNATSGVHGATGSVVGTSDAQTLTNKTFDATSNVSGAPLVGTTTAQTLTNKTLDAVTVSPASPTGTAIVQLNVNAIQRGFVVAAGTAGSFCASAVVGDLVVRSETGSIWISNNAGAPLARFDSLGNIFAPNLTNAWTAYTPASFGNCTSPTGNFAYMALGKTLFLRGTFTGGTATATSGVAFQLPSTFTAKAQQAVTWANSASTTAFTGSIASASANVTLLQSLTAASPLAGLTANCVIEIA